MAVTRETGADLIFPEILDRILDKGIVIDAWVRISLLDLEIATVEARVVVASFETYLDRAPTLSGVELAAPPALDRKIRPSNRYKHPAQKGASVGRKL